MRKSEFLPYRVQTRIDYEDRVQRGRDLAKAEKEDKVLAEMDAFYSGKSTDNKGNAPMCANPFLEFE